MRDMNQYQLTLLGMCEVRWDSFGETRLQTGKTLLFSVKENDDDNHEAGVALLLSKMVAKSLNGNQCMTVSSGPGLSPNSQKCQSSCAMPRQIMQRKM